MFINDYRLKIFILMLATGALAGHFAWHLLAIPAEAALHLAESGLIAGGAVPYVDFIDNMPPLLMYAGLLPTWLGQLCYLPAIFFFNLSILGLVAFAALLLALLGEVNVAGNKAGETGKAGKISLYRALRNPVHVAGLTLVAALLLVTVLRLEDFGQSNQIFFVCLSPYIACRAMTFRRVAVPRLLASLTALCASAGILIDPLFLCFFVLFEFCLFFGNLANIDWSAGGRKHPLRRQIWRRYQGFELQLTVALGAGILALWLLIPSTSTANFLNNIVRLNISNYTELLNPLFYCGNSTDVRPAIFMTGFFLILAAPTFGRNILARFYALASLLSLPILLGQTASLHYQTYPMVGFAALSLAAAIRRLFFTGEHYTDKGVQSLKPPVVAAVLAAVVVVSGGVYAFERLRTPEAKVLKLNNLGYYGSTDRRDLTPLADTVETYSKPGESVAIIALGVRPAYPLITQLKRRPGLAMTWGFPLDILNVLQSVQYEKEIAPLREFKRSIYADMAAQLSGPKAPLLVLLDEGEPRQILDQEGVLKALEANYKNLGGTSLYEGPDVEPTGKLPIEYIGYRSGFSIFRHK